MARGLLLFDLLVLELAGLHDERGQTDGDVALGLICVVLVLLGVGEVDLLDLLCLVVPQLLGLEVLDALHELLQPKVRVGDPKQSHGLAERGEGQKTGGTKRTHATDGVKGEKRESVVTRFAGLVLLLLLEPLLLGGGAAVPDGVEIVVGGRCVLLEDVEPQRLTVLAPHVHQQGVVRNAEDPAGLGGCHALVPDHLQRLGQVVVGPGPRGSAPRSAVLTLRAGT